MRVLGVAIALLICGSQAGADTKTDADQLFVDGRALLDSNPAKACEMFQQANEKQPNSVAILLNLGVCNEKLGKLGSALKYYQTTLNAAAAGSKDPNAKDYINAATDAVSKLADQAARVTIKVKPGAEAVELFVNGFKVEKNTAIPLDAGENTIEARQPGKITAILKLTVKDGDKLDRDIDPLRDAPKPPSAKNRKIAGVAIAGGSIAVAGVITGIWAHGIQKDVSNGDTSKEDGTDQILKPTITFFAIAGVGTAIGAYLFFTKPKWKGESQTGVSAIAPVVTPGSGGLAVLGRF